MAKLSGIYKIQSRSNPDLCYIGGSNNTKKRFSEHLSELKNNKHYNKKLQSYYNEHGKGDLMFVIITECDNNKLVELEKFYIDSINPYFNIYKNVGIRHDGIDDLGRKIVVKISKEFDIKLKEYMLELEKVGVKKTKADVVLYLAEIGILYEPK